MCADRFAEQKARDALEFDPIPQSRWLKRDDKSILVSTAFDPEIVNILKRLGGRWKEETRQWHLPFSAASRLKEALPEIDRLATAAEASKAERESRRQDHLQKERAKVEAEHADRARERALKAPPRPFRREYLIPRQGAPRYWLKLEAIGDDQSALLGRGSMGWVAQLFGTSPRHGFQRSFLNGVKDYTNANSKGSRGVTLEFMLEDGPIYEVFERFTWHRSGRYFLRIEQGVRRLMTEDEVRACLDAAE